MKRSTWFVVACGLAAAALVGAGLGCRAGQAGGQAGRPSAPVSAGYRFVVPPYLQLGDAPETPTDGALDVVWHTEDAPQTWSVETRLAESDPWRAGSPPVSQRVAVGGVQPHLVWSATVRPGRPGAPFAYRLVRDGAPVFEARGRSRKSASQPYRFVVAGDVAQGTAGQRGVARQADLARPDFMLIPGDIVYQDGSVRQYRAIFFPVYNADAAGPGGVPVMRTVPLVAVPGNNDFEGFDLGKTPDGMAYFFYWRQPLNGPMGTLRAPHVPRVEGPDGARRDFLAAAMPRYPQMANFSFDYGNAHWTVLDSNPYADWTKAPLLEWLDRDLAAARGATWRFVAFHHAAFNAPGRQIDLARIQAVGRVLEKHDVSLVFNGHLHTYICSRPLRVGGTGGLGLIVDQRFDGAAVTRADGPIYVVTGAGGATLHNPAGTEMAFWAFLARKHVPDVHSLTVVDVAGRKVTVRQVTAQGREVDRFVLTR